MPPAAEAASTPTLTMTPTATVASTSGVSVALRYATPTRTATSVTLAVPPSWATLVLPQTSRSSRSGYASLGRTGCEATTRITSITRSTAKAATITVASSCAAKGTWTLTIHGLSAPRSVGATTWTARVRTVSGSWRSTNFSVRVGPGTLEMLLGRSVLPTDGTTRVPVYALARDAVARPLAGVAVRFAVGAGATIAPPVATTDRRGVATAYVVGATMPPSPTVTIVATASPLVASATLTAASAGTLTVEAGAGGTVSPSGTASHPLGSTVDVAITPTDPASVPGVMIDGVPVSATPPVVPSTAWGVTVAVTGTNRVDVSFAQLAPMTRVADSATGSAFTTVAPGGTSIRFSARTPFLDGLVVGNILSTSQAAMAAGLAPVLLRINGVERSGPGVTFTTTPAQLTDALASASLDAHIPLVEPLPVATSPATLPATFGDPATSLAGINIGGSATVAGWGDALTSQVGPIAVTGAYQVSGPTLNLSTTIGLSGVTAFRATVSETASASISLDGSSKSSSTERTLAHHAFNGDIVLGAIVVPYVITVDAGAGVESQIGLAFHTKVGLSGTLETGVSYAAGGGWSLVANQDVSFPFDPPNVPAITGQVRGYPFLTVTPAIGFSYGVGSVNISLFCGPYVKAELGFLELGADTSANPWAWLDAGVSVSGGARCSFGDSAELGSVEVVRHRLWDSSGPLVPPTPTPTPTPSTRYQGVFVPTGSMATARAGATATLLPDGEVLVAGGCKPAVPVSASVLATAELYDPATGAFRPTGAMTVGHCTATAASLPDGQVLILGGDSYTNDRNTPIDAAEVYDSRTATFTAVGRMLIPREGAVATPLANGNVLVTGGVTTGYVSTASAEVYDYRARVFRATGAMAVARSGAATVRLADGRVLVAGGSTFTRYVTVLASAEIYDPVGGKFGSTSSMATARDGEGATLLPDGRVLVAGGRDLGEVADAEIYNPRTGKFSRTGSLAVGREVPFQLVLLDGRVLVAGGVEEKTPGQPQSLKSAEIYDPSTGSFSVTGSLPAGFDGGTATRLLDGTVLITPSGQSTPAEIYR